MKLHIELQEGWGGDLVEVSVGGKRAYDGRPTTRMQTGYAAGVEVDLPDPEESVTVEVRLPDRGIITRHEVSIRHETWIGLNLEGDEVRVREQPEQFGYV
ncbi:hypothetical protein [Mycolicibacterium alvei]|uniref:Uncharacterized protein n=1 Tax=Mycolicibacterium alvei TaxID=67081 RepID=A0A6N4UR02_9MYCO|nr:hypothetical protein [Mycolicibacterium alvei]MCV7002300.1 hypothetical protein [Mycolicibacterium alvei]BBX25961.1 hypothetical protein MALV_10860 [Mycolicibacterium alvei]